MSDLAPFVAATLRDKAVMDLAEENKELKEEISELKYQSEPWMVTIHSTVDPMSDESLIVYATCKVSVDEVMKKMRARGDDRSLRDTAFYTLPTNVEGNICKLSEFLQSTITVTTHGGRTESKLIGIDYGNIGYGYNARDGIFKLGWWFFPENNMRVEAVDGIGIQIPIPPHCAHLVTPEIEAGVGVLLRDFAMPLALEVTDDGPITFRNVALNGLGLMNLL